MKKIIFISSILAATALVALVFSFCTKQADPQASSFQDETYQKQQKVKSKVIQLPSGECVILDVVCTQRGDTCLIDGNIYRVECATGKILGTGTYLMENKGKGWNWRVNPPNLPLSPKEMLDLVYHPDFPVHCCGSGGGVVPCGNPIKFNYQPIQLPTGECVMLDVVCCNGEITGTYELVDCSSGKPSGKGGDFSAIYIGDPTKPNEYNKPHNWSWKGDAHAPNTILQVLREADLTPCFN
jgi:hypothetical protein